MHDFDRTEFENDPFNESEQDEPEESWEGDAGPFSAEEEAQLANDLLSVQSEEELNYFLGGLVKSAGQALSSPTGKALVGMLKSAAKKAAPVIGGAVGSAIAPGVGTAIGTTLGKAAGNLLELESESDEELAYEGARTFVRMAGDAIRTAEEAPRGANPRAVAASAVTSAAKQHAPALLRPLPKTGPAAKQGRWLRRGNRVVLFDVF